MNQQIISTIELLSSKIAAKEEEANKLKKLVNELSGEAGLPIPFPNVSDSSQSISSIRSDQFYGQALSSAVRNYLEMRRAANRGAATISEIHQALKAGGFKSETKDDDNAKNTLRISMRKNSSIFHRLPNGEYGLLAWYPSAKPEKDDSDDQNIKKPAKSSKADKHGAESHEAAFSASEIRDAIFARSGNFKAIDVEQDLKGKLPSKVIKNGGLATILFGLKKKGFLKVVAERSGSSGATYCKA